MRRQGQWPESVPSRNGRAKPARAEHDVRSGAKTGQHIAALEAENMLPDQTADPQLQLQPKARKASVTDEGHSGAFPSHLYYQKTMMMYGLVRVARHYKSASSCQSQRTAVCLCSESVARRIKGGVRVLLGTSPSHTMPAPHGWSHRRHAHLLHMDADLPGAAVAYPRALASPLQPLSVRRVPPDYYLALAACCPPHLSRTA